MASAAFVDDRATLGDAYLAELNQRFEPQPASAIIRWAVDTFHPHLCMTASMTDAVLIDRVRAAPVMSRRVQAGIGGRLSSDSVAGRLIVNAAPPPGLGAALT
jgi:hypothetical protein